MWSHTSRGYHTLVAGLLAKPLKKSLNHIADRKGSFNLVFNVKTVVKYGYKMRFPLQLHTLHFDLPYTT